MIHRHQPLDNDTIVAIATPPGNGGIGVLRLSGPLSRYIGQTLSGRETLSPRLAHYCYFRDGEQQLIDNGLLLFFPTPHSFTGEDVVELQGHGGHMVMNLLLNRCIQLGAREARAGEFSERAFLNDKLDLIQAEAIADLINAQTETAARQAQASLQGVFSEQVTLLARELLSLRVFVEAAIDFPEEEIDFLTEGSVAKRLTQILKTGSNLRKQAQQGVIYSHGATVVLAGKPNAGKSSLMNALAEDQVAIVTPQAGTTRDIVKEHINLAGIPIKLTDTAGLRESADIIEQEGVKRAIQAIGHADLTLLVIDDADSDYSAKQLLDEVGVATNVITVINKIDLTGREPGIIDATSISNSPRNPSIISPPQLPAVALSTQSGDGLDALKIAILDALGISSDGATSLFSARERHVKALDAALATLAAAETQFLASGAGELLAEDLKRAHDQLAAITGKVTSDALLGEIFSTFCIGK